MPLDPPFDALPLDELADAISLGELADAISPLTLMIRLGLITPEQARGERVRFMAEAVPHARETVLAIASGERDRGVKVWAAFVREYWNAAALEAPCATRTDWLDEGARGLPGETTMTDETGRAIEALRTDARVLGPGPQGDRARALLAHIEGLEREVAAAITRAEQAEQQLTEERRRSERLYDRIEAIIDAIEAIIDAHLSANDIRDRLQGALVDNGKGGEG